MKRDRVRRILSYYGSKIKLAPNYPQPKFDKIVEPFAGGAGYSCFHWYKKVELYDISHEVISAWDYLIKNRDQIPFLPVDFNHLDELVIPIGAKNLIGFNLNAASASICKIKSVWGRNNNSFWSRYLRKRIYEDSEKVKHWKSHCCRFDEIKTDEPATWFIDPPYQKNGFCYKFGSVGFDYNKLRSWIENLKGQIIVCGNNYDTWFEFDNEIGSKNQKKQDNIEMFSEIIK